MEKNTVRDVGKSRGLLGSLSAIHLLVLVLAAYQVACVLSVFQVMTRPSPGWELQDTADGLRARPTTTSALSLATRFPSTLYMEEINGRPLKDCPGAVSRARWAQSLMDSRSGATNRFVLRAAGGQRLPVTLPVESPSADAFGDSEAGGLLSVLYHLLGLAYLAVGLFVWRKRPDDVASRPLLLFCMVAAFNMAEVFPHGPLSRLLLCVNLFALPFFGPAGLHLAVAVTGQNSRWLRVLLRALLLLAAVFGGAMALAAHYQQSGHPGWKPLLDAATGAAGLELALVTVAIACLCWRAARQPVLESGSCAGSHRARVLVRAMLLAFIVPSLWQVAGAVGVQPGVTLPMEVVQLVALAAFPVLVSQAIIRHRLTELTTAIEQIQQSQARLVESRTAGVLNPLVAGIVHEVNSPLGVLQSGADTVQRAVKVLHRIVHDRQDELGDEARKALRSLDIGRDTSQTMVSASERINGLLDNLQRFINLDEAEFHPVDMRAALETTLQLNSSRFGERIKIARQYPKEAVMVACYPARLNMMFMNLLQNAVDAMDRDGEIRLSVRRRDGQAGISISDSGRGISAEQLPSIFDPGFTDKQGRMGLRLGLSSARRTIKEVGGDISVHSTEGEGTTVELTLPLVDATCKKMEYSFCSPGSVVFTP